MVAYPKGVPTSVAPEDLVDLESLVGTPPHCIVLVRVMLLVIYSYPCFGTLSGGTRIISLVLSTDRDQLSALGHKRY